DLLMCLALSDLCVAGMRLEVDHLATASDASEAAGAVVYSTALSDRGRALATRRQRPAHAACEEETAFITLFDGIGGGRRAFEILGLVPVVHLSFEVDPQAVRVARCCYPGTQHLGDVPEADRVPPTLVGRVIRIILGLRMAMPEAAVDFLGENVASMAESEVLHLNALFERIPLEVEAGDIGWVKRPRLYWTSWDLLPSFESKATMVMAKSSAGRRTCRVALQAERPPLEGLPPAGASCPGAAAGEPLPALVRGLRCPALIHEAGGRVASPDAVARLKLMGFAEGRAAPCMTSVEAKTSPPKHDALRRSSVRTSFQFEVVAWLLGRKLRAGDLASLRCGRVELDEQASRELKVTAAGRASPGPPAVVYVGRGPRLWSLEPSCCGNPFAIVPSASREGAVAQFAGWLRGQPQLLGRLGDLRGATLACHCEQAVSCHADVRLAELAKR
ncbi:unnamed protein product, partial [Prorocentrum cordatum]